MGHKKCCEYMILNSLGDPYKKQTINNAITAMEKNAGIYDLNEKNI